MLGMTFAQLDQPVLALPYLQRAVELNEADTEARFQLGLSLAKVQAYDEAIRQLEKVVEEDPGHADAYYNLGVAYAGHLEDAERALAMFNRALEVQPDHMLAGYGKKMIEKANDI